MENEVNNIPPKKGLSFTRTLTKGLGNDTDALSTIKWTKRSSVIAEPDKRERFKSRIELTFPGGWKAYRNAVMARYRASHRTKIQEGSRKSYTKNAEKILAGIAKKRRETKQQMLRRVLDRLLANDPLGFTRSIPHTEVRKKRALRAQIKLVVGLAPELRYAVVESLPSRPTPVKFGIRAKPRSRGVFRWKRWQLA